ncbi:MAG: hypothetical protein OEW35_13000 [Gammaproteobacteria bacterium]|nr:hypothetical protein [Gammaproteobacteria bacterium]MDH4253922.1 hypothetical protein [Gammaproteobacteria bacterium]MDH5309347.1 hypothetical protein [Gammaproteobacteria bacterium]
MKDGTRTRDLSRSICEEALDEFSKSDDSLAQLVADAHLEVRDFMALSLVCDQSTLSIGQLGRALGLSRESVLHCVERLDHAGLLESSTAVPAHDGHDRTSDGIVVRATAQGRKLTRRILGAG